MEGEYYSMTYSIIFDRVGSECKVDLYRWRWKVRGVRYKRERRLRVCVKRQIKSNVYEGCAGVVMSMSRASLSF